MTAKREGMLTVSSEANRVAISVGPWPTPDDPDPPMLTYVTANRRESLRLAWLVLRHALAGRS